MTDEYPTSIEPKPQRPTLSTKIRFEVFKRDSFTCQYCGAVAPEVVLQVDHIDPVSKGGSSDILNLLTSCQPCNAGKGARPLADTTALHKQKAMLDSLQERREQIEMMLEWQKGLANLEEGVALQISDWLAQLSGYRLNENGLGKLKGWLRKFQPREIIEAIRISKDHYFKYENNEVTKESFEKAFNSISGICANRRREADDPRMATVHRVKAIARKQLTYINYGQLEDAVLSAVDWGIDERVLLRAVREAYSWTGLKNAIMRLMEEAAEEAECPEQD